MPLQSSFSSFSTHSSSSSSFGYAWEYDVFISFRGEDTRYGFTGNLYKALFDKGVHTFIDDEELQRGHEITPSLLTTIEESRIAIIVLSANYASSSFCLDELVHILHCIKGNDRLVLPVFYEVDPSDVRHQRNSFGEAIAKHEKRYKYDMSNKVDKWKQALHQVANLSGYHFKHGDGYEHKFIANIVEEISRKINRVPLPVADYPVGLKSRVSNIISLLEMDSSDRVHMVGIHGIGGIGKTTLAIAVYNLIADNFESVCFLENVRENSSKYGLVHLQNNLLCKILGKEGVQIQGVKEGTLQIQQRLCRKKVLLILDDVDDKKQLESIAGKPDWFGGGSRVIITTRDTHLLKLHNVEKTFEVAALSKEHSLELLVKKAFKNDEVNSSYYANVLNCAITYASGHPLALEIIGSNLFGKEVEHWESALHQYEKIPNREIQQILKISYDALEEYEKNIFLDITCCFKGHNLKEISDILHAHYGDHMTYHIDRLVDKSLIKIKFGDQVTFHDLIEDMGKEIVRQESPNMPGNRSRLWSHEDIVQVLQEKQGTSTVEIIYLEFPSSKMEENGDPSKKKKNKVVQVEWDGLAFKDMVNLKTLIIKNGSFSKGPKYLPNNLRVLDWRRSPLKGFPDDFQPKHLCMLKLPDYLFKSCNLPKHSSGHPKKLSILKLPYYLFKKSYKLDSLFKNLASLNVLNFDNSEYLKEIPDVSGLLTLQKLSFSGCKNLIRVHNSVGILNNLKVLKAEDCQSLRTFPSINLPSLEILMLSGCNRLEKFPEILGKMEKVEMLRLCGTNIKHLPSSFQNLCELSHLILIANTFHRIPSVILDMPKLFTLLYINVNINNHETWASRNKLEEGVEGTLSSSNVSNLTVNNYMLSDNFFPLALAWFRNVKTLDLSRNRFTILPECIQDFRFLSSLKVDFCTKLVKIAGIPPNLKQFSAVGCSNLTEEEVKSVLLNQELHENGRTEFALPGTTIPAWFEEQGKGDSISFWFRGEFPSNALCFAILQRNRRNGGTYITRITTMVSINGKQVSRGGGRTQMQDLFIFDLSVTNKTYHLDGICFENKWNHANVSFEFQYGGEMEFGMHILKQESSSIMKDIQFTNCNSPDHLPARYCPLWHSNSPDHKRKRPHKALHTHSSKCTHHV
ncbi:disease resistance protein RPV1-like [Arachis duranensis]|uniref:Disease resistance protein RPV1-like n=1 Tax=Arachis duranensis TaxID=130453 RepID=A0A9C6TJZ0_ARADU|nr:disease resistance protein RPV1-like [Arachis duranensis]